MSHSRARLAARLLVQALLLTPAVAVDATSSPSDPESPAMTIVDLQPLRTETQMTLRRVNNEVGTATLMNLNPRINAWFLLTLDWSASGQHQTYHLESTGPDAVPSLLTGPAGALLLDFGGRSSPCTLGLDSAAGAPGTLDVAQASGLPYAPICDARLYVRNQTVGRATSLEKVTDFLRAHVWGGEQIITLVKKELYRDAFREEPEPHALLSSAVSPQLAPAGAILDPVTADLAVVPPHLGLEVDSASQSLLLGRWYGLRALPDVYLSVAMPEVIAHDLLHGHEASVNPLDPTESAALVYLVAFDLAKLDLHFSLGTEHPHLGWSPRPPLLSQDPRLPGPDGIDRAAPVVSTGMVSPGDAAHTIATFAGGFKREHGAFRYGALAARNHGSHYGFVEQGVVFSTLQPGLATVFTTVSGEVHMDTWTQADTGRMADIRDARQNGVPLIQYDARRGASVPGSLVNRWGDGNWSGSANEDLRTLRAGLCLQETGSRHFLVFAYFSSATPSAMARVLQAYRCRYAMQLDINALEHTYFALYISQNGQRIVEHLIDGMDVLDRHAREQLAPRFVGFPDDRDFFYVTRRQRP